MSVYAGPADWWTDGTDSGRTHIATKGVVQSGLVLNLDAGVSSSYPGSGYSWTDIKSNNIATLSSGLTFSSTNGGSIFFSSATNDTIIIPYTSAINSATTFTIDMWFKKATSTEQMLFSTSDLTNAKGWHIEVFNSKLLMQVYPGSSYQYSTQVLSLDTYYNCVVTYNAGITNYYINNVSSGSQNYSFTPSLSNVYIGSWGSSSTYYFKGYIPSVKFYNRVLSALEISQNYNALRGRFGL